MGRGEGRTADDEERLDEGARGEDAERDAVPQRPEDRDSVCPRYESESGTSSGRGEVPMDGGLTAWSR